MINSTLKIFIEKFSLNKDTIITDLQNSPYKNDYNSCSFKIQDHRIIFRNAKTTPKKTGLFTAIWKKDSQLKNTPLHQDDDFDYLVIHVEHENHKGLFVFSKPDLINLQIIESLDSKGKMGIRLYPLWCTDLNKQAQKTQQEQSAQFIWLNP